MKEDGDYVSGARRQPPGPGGRTGQSPLMQDAGRCSKERLRCCETSFWRELQTSGCCKLGERLWSRRKLASLESGQCWVGGAKCCDYLDRCCARRRSESLRRCRRNNWTIHCCVLAPTCIIFLLTRIILPSCCQPGLDPVFSRGLDCCIENGTRIILEVCCNQIASIRSMEDG